MRLKYMLLIPLAVTLMAVAQDKPPATTPIPLAETARVAVLQARFRQKSVEADYLRLQAQLSQLETQYRQAGESLQAAIDAAYVAAKLDRKEWTLDVEKLEFTPSPKPVTPAVAPAKK